MTGEVLLLKVQETLAPMAFLRRKLTSVTTDGERNKLSLYDLNSKSHLPGGYVI